MARDVDFYQLLNDYLSTEMPIFLTAAAHIKISRPNVASCFAFEPYTDIAWPNLDQLLFNPETGAGSVRH
jgi:hypothetical protein